MTFWTRAGSALAQKIRPILLGLGAIALVGGGAWIARTMIERRKAEVSRAFGRIERIATAALIPEKSDAPKNDDDLPHFKTDKERLDAAAKEAQGFVGAHANSSLVGSARLLLARFNLTLGNAAEADKMYREVLAASPEPKLRFLADEGVIHALEALGKIDEAIAKAGALADQAAQAGGFYADRALFTKARLLQDKGDKKEAEKILRQVLEKSPQTALRDQINDRLAVLEAK